MFTHKFRRHQRFTSEHVLISTHGCFFFFFLEKPAAILKCLEKGLKVWGETRRLQINFTIRLWVILYTEMKFFFFLMKEITCFFFSFSFSGNVKSKRSVESVTEHWRWSSVLLLLLSGGKLLHQLNFTHKNWFSATTVVWEDPHCCIMQREEKFIYCNELLLNTCSTELRPR